MIDDLLHAMQNQAVVEAARALGLEVSKCTCTARCHAFYAEDETIKRLIESGWEEYDLSVSRLAAEDRLVISNKNARFAAIYRPSYD